MILHLKPNDDELVELNSLTSRNLDSIWDYTPENTLPYELPFSEQEFAIALQIKDVLAQGGRVLLLTPDSENPQELLLEQEV